MRLSERLGGLLGAISDVGARAEFPVAGLTANRLAAKRTVLVGEAAHILPPIGAQGLNLGFRDAAALADCVAEALREGRDPGGEDVLEAYTRARRLDVMTRTLGVDLLSRSLLTSLPPLQAARGIVLHGLKTLPPLRRAVMRARAHPSDRAAEPDAPSLGLSPGSGLDALPRICHERASHAHRPRTPHQGARPWPNAPTSPFLRDLRYRLEYLGLRFLIGLVRLVPIDLAASISAKAWRLLAPLNRRRHKRALANLARAFPDKTPEERERIALAAWENLGRVMVETMNIDRILKEPDRLHVTNGHWITRYKDKMGPVLIVTMHMGNWELGMWPMMLAGVRPAGVYRQVKNPYVDRYLRAPAPGSLSRRPVRPRPRARARTKRRRRRG